MKRIFESKCQTSVAVVALLLAIGLLGAACGNDDDGGEAAPTKADPGAYTQAFVDDAVGFYESNGRGDLIEHFHNPNSTDPLSVDGEWYVFVYDLDGVVLAHPTVPENVGQTLHEILGATPEGLASADEMVAATETGNWVEYVYLNPQIGAQETKHSWIVRRDDVFIGSGWYESG